MKRPTIQQLQEALDYNPMLGVVWRHRPREHFLSDLDWSNGNARWAGEKAGSKTQIRLKIQGQRFIFPISHAIWALKHGKWPEDEIDHRNGDGLDNEPTNLREATRSEQNQNRKMPSHNTSGFVGVTKDGSKWRARITLNKTVYNLGLYLKPEDAYEAYLKAKEKLHEFQPKPRTATGP